MLAPLKLSDRGGSSKENTRTGISPGTDTTLRTEMIAKPEMTPFVGKTGTITKTMFFRQIRLSPLLSKEILLL